MGLGTPGPPVRARAVTFDCWGTLIYERETRTATERRVSALVRASAAAGTAVTGAAAREALDLAWQRHRALWLDGIATGTREIASWALSALGVSGVAVAETLARDVSEAALASEIVELEGARTTLERLAVAGIRRALICDTGFTPGRVVRRLLARAGLLELLEVQIFSDEVGVPKPDRKLFQSALAALGVSAEAALHVGDLRRTDVAGARAAGMRSVRIRQHYDDRSEHPEADHVVESHAQLQAILGL